MTNELVTPEMKVVFNKAVSKGIVRVHKEEGIVLNGPYRWSAGAAHLVDHLESQKQPGEWCTVECFAKFVDRTKHQENVLRARGRMRPLAAELLRHGMLLLIAYDGDGGAKSAMRLLSPADDPDVVEPQIARMVQMRDVSASRARAMLEVVRNMRKLLEPPPETEQGA